MGDPIAEFVEWFRCLPIIPKTYFTLSILMHFCIYFQLLSVEQVYLDAKTLLELQIWRIPTSIIYENGFSVFAYALQFYVSYSILATFSEKILTRAAFGECLWILTLLTIYTTVACSVKNVYMPNHLFWSACIGIWYLRKPLSQIQFILGLSISISYLPIAYFVYVWMMGPHAYLYQLAAGSAFAALYYVSKTYIYPKTGRDIFSAPALFERLVQKYQILECRWKLVSQYERVQEEQDPYNVY